LPKTREIVNITALFDRKGFSLLHFAAYKDKLPAIQSLIYFLSTEE